MYARDKMIEYLAKEDNLKILLEVEPLIVQVKEYLIKSFTQELSRELRKIFREPDWIVEGELNWSGNNEKSAVSVFKKAWENCFTYTIDTEESHLQAFGFGIRRCQENKNPTDEWEKELHHPDNPIRRYLGEPGEQGPCPWWVIWFEPDREFKNDETDNLLRIFSQPLDRERALKHFVDKMLALKDATETMIDAAVTIMDTSNNTADI